MNLRFFPALLAVLMLAASSPAPAFSAVSFRGLANLGAWSSVFNQIDSTGHSVQIPMLIGPGFQFQLGANIGHFFLEYNFSWLWANYLMDLSTDENNSTVVNDPRNGTYFSPGGLHLGINVPGLPIEPYIGYEKALFGFSQGAGATYYGSAPKAGLNVFFTDAFGLKAEYKKLFATSDDAGSLPKGVKTRIDTYSIMLVFGAR